MNQPDLGGALLKAVSRSFFLTLRVLPKALREPISLAYLLARASDTIADTTDISADAKSRHLRAFIAMLEQGRDEEKLAALRAEITSSHHGEQTLIAELPHCFAWLAAQREDDRADIVEVLKKITRGQELDALRFQDATRVVALQNAAELEEYTYLVAGCVGEFWTKLCFRHLLNFSRENERTMREWGINFGKGLQLVNILRDLPADLRVGRCYLPADELSAAGSDFKNPDQKVFDHWLQRAEQLLDDAFRYIEATRSWRLRYACFLPWYLGVRTLVLLRQTPPHQISQRVKVSRSEVKTALIFASFAATSNVILRRLQKRLRVR
jgi:farnesyl-diphosphate farnesyltransferase